MHVEENEKRKAELSVLVVHLICGTSTGFCTSEPEALVVATEYGRPQCSFGTRPEQHIRAMDRSCLIAKRGLVGASAIS